MVFFYHTLLSLIFMAVQTTAFRHFYTPIHYCDFSVPCIVFLNLNRSTGSSLLIALLSGIFIDSISAGVFGVYTGLHLWIVFIVKIAIRFFYMKDFFFKIMIIFFVSFFIVEWLHLVKCTLFFESYCCLSISSLGIGFTALIINFFWNLTVYLLLAWSLTFFSSFQSCVLNKYKRGLKSVLLPWNC